MFRKFLLVAAVASFSVNAFGAFTIDNVVEATKLAIDDFKVTSAHAEHFLGFKSWKSGDDVKVKIYINHDGMAMEANYNCHQHDGEIECHLQ